MFYLLFWLICLKVCQSCLPLQRTNLLIFLYILHFYFKNLYSDSIFPYPLLCGFLCSCFSKALRYIIKLFIWVASLFYVNNNVINFPHSSEGCFHFLSFICISCANIFIQFHDSIIFFLVPSVAIQHSLVSCFNFMNLCTFFSCILLFIHIVLF